MSSNLKARGVVLRSGEKALRDNVPIRFNDWATIGGSKKDPDASKANIIKISVLTHNHGVGSKNTSKDCSIGTKSSLKLDRIEDNPKAVIEVWQSILNEMLPALIDVDPITAVELFEAHLTGSAAKEFQQIAYKVSDKLYESYIDVEFNMRIASFRAPEKSNAELTQEQRDALPDDQRIKANELAKWLAKNEVRKNARTGMSGFRAYNYTFPPPRFPRPPARPSKGKFHNWSISGINALNANAWLRQHNHGWEYGEKYLDMIFKGVQELMFKQYGKHAGRTQIDYLTEDLRMESTHSMKQFFRILTAHSEAQPFYPALAMDKEVADPFSDERKIQIVWNAGFELYKDELTVLGIARREDLQSDFEKCKNKFLLAEQHKKAKEEKTSPKSKPSATGSKSKEKGKSGAAESAKSRYKGRCGYCNKPGHKSCDCYDNPKSDNYRPKKSGGNEPATKKRRINRDDPKFKKWKEEKEYDQYCQETGGNDSDYSTEK